MNYLDASVNDQFLANPISSVSLLTLFPLDNIEGNPIDHLASFVKRLNGVT